MNGGMSDEVYVMWVRQAKKDYRSAVEFRKRFIQPCGHPKSSIVYSDGGTHYCRECENNAKKIP